MDKHQRCDFICVRILYHPRPKQPHAAPLGRTFWLSQKYGAHVGHQHRFRPHAHAVLFRHRFSRLAATANTTIFENYWVCLHGLVGIQIVDQRCTAQQPSQRACRLTYQHTHHRSKPYTTRAPNEFHASRTLSIRQPQSMDDGTFCPRHITPQHRLIVAQRHPRHEPVHAHQRTVHQRLVTRRRTASKTHAPPKTRAHRQHAHRGHDSVLCGIRLVLNAHNVPSMYPQWQA